MHKQSVELMTQSVEHLVEVLRLLDEAQAPGEIGAQVDHARERICICLDRARVVEASSRSAA